MKYLVDGSNLLGRTGSDRVDDEVKRRLVRSMGSLARAKRAKVVCYFDGFQPPSFGTGLGTVRVVFSGKGSADDLIAAQAKDGKEPLVVVTSDRELAARVLRRNVQVVRCEDFRREMEALPSEEGVKPDEDWASYFSDPQNRIDF